MYSFAKKVARIAEFYYDYISIDLNGVNDDKLFQKLDETCSGLQNQVG